MIIASRKVFWSLRPKLKAVFSLVLLFTAVLTLFGEADFDRDEALSRAYVRVLLDLDKHASASSSLLDAAVEFDPDNSDARYLRAKRMLEEGSSIEPAVNELEFALDSDKWYYCDRTEALLFLVGLNDRLMRYGVAVKLLSSVPSRERTDGSWYYYALRSALNSGQLQDALAIAREGTRLFPENEEIKSLRVALDPGYKAFFYKKIIESERTSVSEMLLRNMILASSAEERAPLIQRYLELGYDNPEINVLRDLSPGSENDQDITLLLTEKNQSRLSILRHSYLLFEQNQREDEFREFFADRRIEVFEDCNNDGYDDGIYTIENGWLVEVRQDRDQDFEDEIVIRFNKNVEETPQPVKISLLVNNEDYIFEYGRYPEVLQVKIKDEEAVTELSFAETVLTIEMVDFKHIPPFASVDVESIPAKKQLEDLAYLLTVYGNEGIVQRGPSGVTIREEQGVKLQIRTEGEDLVIERDLSGNGSSRITEIYRDNSLYGVYLDQDSNGIFEYFYYPTRDLHEWDWDQDGEIDYQSYNGE
jgi:tetratricopeptide (TPR) repeat protein